MVNVNQIIPLALFIFIALPLALALGDLIVNQNFGNAQVGLLIGIVPLIFGVAIVFKVFKDGGITTK